MRTYSEVMAAVHRAVQAGTLQAEIPTSVRAVEQRLMRLARENPDALRREPPEVRLARRLIANEG